MSINMYKKIDLSKIYQITKQDSHIYLTPFKHENTLIWMHGLGDEPLSYAHVFTDP